MGTVYMLKLRNRLDFTLRYKDQDLGVDTIYISCNSRGTREWHYSKTYKHSKLGSPSPTLEPLKKLSIANKSCPKLTGFPQGVTARKMGGKQGEEKEEENGRFAPNTKYKIELNESNLNAAGKKVTYADPNHP